MSRGNLIMSLIKNPSDKIENQLVANQDKFPGFNLIWGNFYDCRALKYFKHRDQHKNDEEISSLDSEQPLGLSNTAIDGCKKWSSIKQGNKAFAEIYDHHKKEISQE